MNRVGQSLFLFSRRRHGDVEPFSLATRWRGNLKKFSPVACSIKLMNVSQSLSFVLVRRILKNYSIELFTLHSRYNNRPAGISPDIYRRPQHIEQSVNR